LRKLCAGGRIAERNSITFSKTGKTPDLKKEMLNKKRKTEEHNFRKILRKKSPFRSILSEDMQSEDDHNLWQEEKLLPPCHKLCCFRFIFLNIS
jgi:hypothetical protein